MPRATDPAVRIALVERAAAMLARREPVTLRALVDGAGTSTMAVYTHFGGMPGLWQAVRREGFGRLNAHLAAVGSTADPVRDLAALGAAYIGNALANPDLYRVMFDAAADLEDPEAAAEGFQRLASCAVRARNGGRFDTDTDADAVATRFWAAGHGLAMLVLTGVLPTETIDLHGPALGVGAFLAAGDEPERCRQSVQAGWASVRRPRAERLPG